MDHPDRALSAARDVFPDDWSRQNAFLRGVLWGIQDAYETEGQ